MASGVKYGASDPSGVTREVWLTVRIGDREARPGDGVGSCFWLPWLPLGPAKIATLAVWWASCRRSEWFRSCPGLLRESGEDSRCITDILYRHNWSDRQF